MTTSSVPAPARPADAGAPARGGGRAGYAAAAYLGSYGILALLWTITGSGYPFASDDDEDRYMLLHSVPAHVGAPLFAVVLLATVALALAIAGTHAVRLRGTPRRLVLGAGWAVSGALLLGVPSLSVLALVGYAPMLILGAPFGWPDIDYGDVFSWSMINQAICLAGGFLLARAVLTWQRRTRDACADCGRPGTPDPSRALRTGRWAVGVAVAIPLLYAASRYAWVLDVPLFISRDDLRQLRADGMEWAGAGLATFAAAGALLTLGLVQRWGEVFPRWMPRVHGRPVPVRLAVVPASFVTVVVLAGTLGPSLSPEMWRDPAAVPVALMPLWGVALGVATWAYRMRRQGPCPTCGRGLPAARG